MKINNVKNIYKFLYIKIGILDTNPNEKPTFVNISLVRS